MIKASTISILLVEIDCATLHPPSGEYPLRSVVSPLLTRDARRLTFGNMNENGDMRTGFAPSARE